MLSVRQLAWPRHGSHRRLISTLALVCAACAWLAIAAASPAAIRPLPPRAQQGQLLVASAPSGSRVLVDGRAVRLSPAGLYAFGIPRDQRSAIEVRIESPGEAVATSRVEVQPRAWPIEQIAGLPPATVNPPPEIAARIAREQASVAKVRERDAALEGFAQNFIWPLQGRISGRFGSERRYNGQPGAPHSGLDIAAASGTAVHAPADGVVSFVGPDLYLTGGTLVLDHGHGVSSVFLHLSRIDVEVGRAVTQGDLVAAVGATGRASGAHLHWGLNWFDTRLDPLLVLPNQDTPP